MQNKILYTTLIASILASSTWLVHAQTQSQEIGAGSIEFWKSASKNGASSSSSGGAVYYYWSSNSDRVVFNAQNPIDPSGKKPALNQCVALAALNAVSPAASANAVGQDFTIQYFSDSSCATLIASADLPANPSQIVQSPSGGQIYGSQERTTFDTPAQSFKIIPLANACN